MTKLLLIISLLALIGSAGIGVVNRQAFIKLRAEKDDTNTKIQGLIDGDGKKYLEDIRKTYTNLKTVEVKLAEDEATLDLTQSNLVTANREIAAEKEKESPLDEKIGEFNAVLTKIQEKYPNTTAAEIGLKIEELKKTKKTLGTEEEALLAEVEVLSKKVDANLAEVARREEKQKDRAVGIARNVMQATITAVNQDWGFVVFNAGEDMGITPESKLYIKRGTSIIGRLKPINVESRLTVANIQAKTLAEGAVVLPGDKVILGTVSE